MTAEDIHAIRAGAVAIVAQCDAALARMQQLEEMVTHSTSGVTHSTSGTFHSTPTQEQASCGHARIARTGVMGAPLLARCLDCGGAIEVPAEPSGVHA